MVIDEVVFLRIIKIFLDIVIVFKNVNNCSFKKYFNTKSLTKILINKCTFKAKI